MDQQISLLQALFPLESVPLQCLRQIAQCHAFSLADKEFLFFANNTFNGFVPLEYCRDFNTLQQRLSTKCEQLCQVRTPHDWQQWNEEVSYCIRSKAVLYDSQAITQIVQEAQSCAHKEEKAVWNKLLNTMAIQHHGKAALDKKKTWLDYLRSHVLHDDSHTQLQAWKVVSQYIMQHHVDTDEMAQMPVIKQMFDKAIKKSLNQEMKGMLQSYLSDIMRVVSYNHMENALPVGLTPRKKIKV